VFAINAFSLSSRTDILAGKPARYHVNNASPGASVEGTNIIPNGERWQVPFILSLHESSSAVGVELHGADGAPSEEHASENASSSAAEKCQLTHDLLLTSLRFSLAVYQHDRRT
jgi:hypothetical protein